MTLKFTTTDQAATEHGVKTLVYGTAGIGKTTLCSTTPNPIIISAEAGLLSLRNQSIPVIEIKTVEDLTEAHQFVENSEDANQFDTICLDSITEIGETVLANAKAQVKDPRQAYGELIEKMLITIKAFRDTKNKHVLMSAKMELNKDELTGVQKHRPAMPGAKLGQQIPYLFDEVFHMGVNKTQEGTSYRYLRTQPDLQYEAKDRSGMLDEIERPDMSYVIGKILNQEV